MMDISDKIWEKGDGVENEDIANQVGRFSWVLDGATAIIKHHEYTPRWLVEHANKILTEGAHHAQSLAGLLAYYKEHTILQDDYHALLPEERPSFAAALIHQRADGILEYLHLADCFTVLKQDDGVTILRDEDYATRAKRDAPTLQPGFYDLPKDEQLKLQIARRRSINTPHGYWMGTADGAAFDAVPIMETPVMPQTAIIMCSDGFEAAVQSKLYSWPDVFDANLGDVVSNLRKVEKAGAHGLLRVKKSDDATALKLRL